MQARPGLSLSPLFGLAILATLATFILTCVINIDLVHYPFAYEADEANDLQVMISHTTGLSSWNEFLDRYFIHSYSTYHGLITLVLPGVLSILPLALWGEWAQIYTYKMLAPGLLLLSYWLLSMTYLRDNFFRALAILFLLGLPYTGMFLVWSRPENFLFFFTALFLFIQVPKNFRASWPFLFLGMGFISHISLAPYIPCFLLWGGSEQKKANLGPSLIKSYIFKSLIWLGLGVILAQPHFLLPSNIIRFVSEKHFQMYNDITVDPSLDYTVWLTERIPTYVGSPWLFALLLVVLFFLLCKLLRNQKQEFFRISAPRIVFTLVPALFCLLNIMLFIQIHFSGYYLQFHFALLLLTFLTIAESFISQKKSISYFIKGFLLFLAFFGLASRMPFMPFASIPFSIHEKLNFSRSERFQKKLQEAKKAQEIAQKLASTLDRKVKVSLFSDIYLLKSDSIQGEEVTLLKSWEGHPFRGLSLQQMPFDGLIMPMKSFHPEKLRQVPGAMEKENQEWIHLYEKFVTPTWGGKCHGANCLEVVPINENLSLFYIQKLDEEYRLKKALRILTEGVTHSLKVKVLNSAFPGLSSPHYEVEDIFSNPQNLLNQEIDIVVFEGELFNKDDLHQKHKKFFVWTSGPRLRLLVKKDLLKNKSSLWPPKSSLAEEMNNHAKGIRPSPL